MYVYVPYILACTLCLCWPWWSAHLSNWYNHLCTSAVCLYGRKSIVWTSVLKIMIFIDILLCIKWKHSTNVANLLIYTCSTLHTIITTIITRMLYTPTHLHAHTHTSKKLWCLNCKQVHSKQRGETHQAVTVYMFVVHSTVLAQHAISCCKRVHTIVEPLYSRHL